MTTYQLPPLTMLDPGLAHEHGADLAGTAAAIRQLAAEHNVEVDVDDWQVGPQVTRYLLRPGPGVAPRKVQALEEALSVRLATQVRYAGPCGDALGVEVPHPIRGAVALRTLIENGPALAGLGVAVGVAIDGSVQTGALAKLPHLLVAGATGQGKSVFINALLSALLMRCTPRELQLTLVDPKRVELTAYAQLPHLARPIITEAADAADALRRAVDEMELRYQRMAAVGVKDIAAWNDREQSPWARHVIVIDELADLMMSGGKSAEAHIVRIAQLGRAAGIHLVLATQYPNAKVVTPLIKQNVPSRIAFTVADHTASNLILGSSGAERLTGAGDALWAPVGSLAPVRVQTPFVSAEEVTRLVAWWVKVTEPDRVREGMLAKLERDRKATEAAARARRDQEEAAQREAATAEAEETLAEEAAAVMTDGLGHVIRGTLSPAERIELELADEMERDRLDVVERIAKLEEIVTLQAGILEAQQATITVLLAATGMKVPS